MSLAATDHQRPSEGAGGEQENSGKARPFSEYVCFETEGGLALLYEPVPLDRWIGRKIYHDWRTRKYFDRTTGDELTEEDTKDYKRYVKRHTERRDTARQLGELSATPT